MLTAPSVNILGGWSFREVINVTSDQFISTARWQNGEIHISIRSRSSIDQFVARMSSYPIPRVLNLFIFLLSALNLKERVLLAVVVIGVVVAPLFFEMDSFSFLPLTFLLAILILQSILLVIQLRKIAGVAAWHGAEHMAITTYWKNDSTDMEAIKLESPIQNKCGGRLVLPLILTIALSFFLATFLPIHFLILYIGILEPMLWIDKLIGFEHLPIFSHFSTALQRYITTREPSEKELVTAQAAVQNLLKAHQDQTYESSS